MRTPSTCRANQPIVNGEAEAVADRANQRQPLLTFETGKSETACLVTSAGPVTG